MHSYIGTLNHRQLHSYYFLGLIFAIAPVTTLMFLANKSRGAQPTPTELTAPELAGISQWINSRPLMLKKLRGKVVVLHFWTFGCTNCQRNLPYYNRWRTDFSKDGLQIIGVHTPETAEEAVASNVAARVKDLGIKYPIAVDQDRATWKAYNNRYWPSIYLIDKQGHIRFHWDGELEYQDARGDKTIREKIKELLAETNQS